MTQQTGGPMDEHVGERLSAYLDRELPAAEAATVEAHLRGCATCREHLETMAAVDAAARALPVSAPEGYFEGLPSRISARLAAGAAVGTAAGSAVATPAAEARVAARPLPFEPRRKRLRIPAWTWAVAAVLALAVI